MSFLASIRSVFTHYASFEGRATRSEYWYFALFLFVGQSLLTAFDMAFLGYGFTFPGPAMLAQMNHAPLWVWGSWHYQLLGLGFWMHGGSPLSFLFMLGTILPLLALTARRLHDTGHSGWWQLWWAVPVMGPIVMLGVLAQPTQDAGNLWPAQSA